MQTRGRPTRGAALAALAFLITTGCATTPPPAPRAVQAGDLRSLAGEWQGTLTGATGSGSFAGPSFSVRLTVGADGTFTSVVDGNPGQGTARVEGGKLLYEGSNSRGSASLYEQGGRLLLKGEGTMVGFNGRCTFELTRR